MPVPPRSWLLPGAPRWALGLVAAAAIGNVVLTLAGALPEADSVGRLLLGIAVGFGTGTTLVWRWRRVPHDRDVWRRICLGAATILAIALVGGLLALVPGTRPLATSLISWAPLVAFPLLHGGLVGWNRFGTDLADPQDILNGTAAVLVVDALLNLLLRASDAAILDQSWAVAQPQVALIAATFVLTGSAASAAFLGGMQRDPRPWLIAAQFATLCAAGLASALTGSPPWWASAVSALGGLGLALSAALRPTAAPPRPADLASATIGAFLVIATATVVLLAIALGTPLTTAIWCAALATTASSLRLLINTRELVHLAVSRREALTDELTGAANRRAVLRRLDELCADGVPLSFALLDLDKFKEVNDGLGHAAGDELLRQIAARLQPVLRQGDLLGRLGGDEFAVVTIADPGTPTEDVAAALCRRLLAALQEPFRVGGMSVHVGASIGSAGSVGTWGADAPAQLLREADAAMYDAKRSGSGWAYYDRSRHTDAGTRLALVEQLRSALGDSGDDAAAAGELVLYHQPQIDVASGRTRGVEVLVRWAHPTRGLLGPDSFLPAAEAHGLMHALTERVLTLAVAQLASWQHQGLDLRMSVNLSASNLLDAALPRRVAALLDQHGVRPADLVLEVTESVLLSDPDRSLAVVAELQALGVGISIDDFGTGYCSLAYLRELPVDELKLDRSFTADLLADERTAAIVASTIDLAHRLGLRVVAEGVEDDDTYARLAELGCDESQGFLHSRPLPAADLVAWLDGQLAPLT